MLTDPAKYGDARGATPDRLRTAAWLQYLIDHLDTAVCAMAATGVGDATVAASHAIRAGAGANLSREATAVLHRLVPWIAADGGGCACDPTDPPGACSHVPSVQQLAEAERCCPGSRAVFDTAHGVIDACTFDDPDVGWAALERIADGVECAGRDSGARIAARHDGRCETPPAKNLRDRLAAIAATPTRPGAVIDATVLRLCGPRDDAARVDEMAALAMFAAELAAGNGVSVQAYGGRHNFVAQAIRTHRTDLASKDGLLAALAVCRLDRLVGAGSFWACYLLAGIVIAAPGTVREIGHRFWGDTWQTWLDHVLAWPAVSRFGVKEDVAFDRLRDAMSLTSRRNPIVRAKRMRGVSAARPRSANEKAQ
ncbi:MULTISPECIES: hypothetical protein [Burkholderia]|uniref:hypothetical protein n=1 Tax=Burkholderia TaxID=32008 RepID=UPI0009825390|nr:MULTISPECIES: hypothetical protein [Burkholderia]AQQ39499.1 hypothetical protein A8E75_11020 [Burkholderia cenocepacia]MBG0878826.1 hypothetical protein [Burkholderia sp. 9775_39]MBG0884069.1 hypothetical protein [Burkholderia sp. 9773_38]ONV22846.1 hypothetical protein A8E74_14505 [Burkholderia cenocepacia]ONV35898.1 hypothetical protein A8E77_11085 [Burkholderia cenocepacia]